MTEFPKIERDQKWQNANGEIVEIVSLAKFRAGEIPFSRWGLAPVIVDPVYYCVEAVVYTTAKPFTALTPDNLFVQLTGDFLARFTLMEAAR